MRRWSKTRWAATVLLLLVVSCGVYQRLAAGGPYRGRVIDSETKQPLEGAVVLAVWYTMTPALADVMYLYLDAEEALTDKDGRFVVGKHPPMTWRPISWVDSPRITIFYPGYGFYPRYHVSPPWPPGGTDTLLEMMEKEELVIELPQLKTREERINVLHKVPVDEAPRERIPNLIRLVNIEWKRLNLPPEPLK